MLRTGLEKLFDRYRRRGDAAALAEVFDRTSPELWKLALHLVREPAEAEDVLQNTYVAAIENAESFDASRQLVPWLVGILAKQASLARRRAAREVEPDRLDRRDSEEPSDRAALVEFSSKLAEALESLPEPYREVLRLHLADGRKPIEIARELGRAPGTVRMQVHRGLDLLRRALPAGFAAGLGATLLPTRGMAAVREAVLAHAVRNAALTGASLAPATGAALSLAALAQAGVAVLALAGGAWWWIARSAPAEAPPAAAPAVADAPAGARPTPAIAEPARSGRAALAEAPSAAAPSSAPAAAQRRWLSGKVRGAAPAESASVALEVRGLTRSQWPEERVVRGAPGPDGEFRLDVTPIFAGASAEDPLEGLILDADDPHSLRTRARIELDRPETRSEFRADVELAPAGLLTGRALCEDSRATEVRVAALALADGVPEMPVVDSAMCAPDGSFTLRLRDGREHVVVAIAAGHRPEALSARAAPGSQASLATLTLSPGVELAGTVMRDRTPVTGAMVSARALEGGAVVSLFGSRLAWRGGSFERAGAAADSDADGRYRIGGLAPGKYALEVGRTAKGVPAAARLAREREVTAPDAAADFEIESARIALTVRDADGEPARGRVRLLAGERPIELKLSERGTADFEVPAEQELALAIECAGMLSRELRLVAPRAGEELRETVDLKRQSARAALALALTLPEGFVADSATLEFFARGEDEPARAAAFARKAPLVAGSLALDDLAPGSYHVAVHVGGTYRHYVDYLAPAELDVELAAGTEARAVLAVERGGRLRCLAVDESGAPLAAACELYDASGVRRNVRFVARATDRTASSFNRLSELGACDVYPGLPAGDYELALAAPGRESVRTHVRVEPGRTAEIRVELRHRTP